MEQILKIEISANAVAWYAAIVATVGIIISLFNYLRDKGKISVKVTEFKVLNPTHVYRGLQISVKAVNIGRRPVTLTSAGFSLENGYYLTMPIPLEVKFPHTLYEGKEITVLFDKKELQKQQEEAKSLIKNAYYIDTKDKEYKTEFKLKSDN